MSPEQKNRYFTNSPILLRIITISRCALLKEHSNARLLVECQHLVPASQPALVTYSRQLMTSPLSKLTDNSSSSSASLVPRCRHACSDPQMPCVMPTLSLRKRPFAPISCLINPTTGRAIACCLQLYMQIADRASLIQIRASLTDIWLSRAWHSELFCGLLRQNQALFVKKYHKKLNTFIIQLQKQQEKSRETKLTEEEEERNVIPVLICFYQPACGLV